MYHILIAGAGYTGTAIARFFSAKKQKVYVLTRSAEKAGRFAAEGIEPLVMDLTRPETLQLPPVHFVVMAAAPDERTEESYRRIYLEGNASLLGALSKNARPFLVTYLSSSGVWPDRGGAWTDESVEARPDTERARILYEAEKQVLGWGYPAVVLRLAGIYGPGRNRLKARSGTPETGKARWMNLIHVDDIAAAMPVIFKKAVEGSVLNVVDDEPVASPDFYDWLAREAGRPELAALGGEGKPQNGKRLSNRHLKELGVSLQYPTFREGYRPLLTEKTDAC